MATLTIKNMPDSLYQALKEQAAASNRSLNREAIVSLALVVNKNCKSEQNILLNAKSLRIKKNPIITLTEVLIKKAKEKGRL